MGQTCKSLLKVRIIALKETKNCNSMYHECILSIFVKHLHIKIEPETKKIKTYSEKISNAFWIDGKKDLGKFTGLRFNQSRVTNNLLH